MFNPRYELWKYVEHKWWTGSQPNWFWYWANRLIAKEGYGPRAIYESLQKPVPEKSN